MVFTFLFFLNIKFKSTVYVVTSQPGIKTLCIRIPIKLKTNTKDLQKKLQGKQKQNFFYFYKPKLDTALNTTIRRKKQFVSFKIYFVKSLLSFVHFKTFKVMSITFIRITFLLKTLRLHSTFLYLVIYFELTSQKNKKEIQLRILLLSVYQASSISY